jgi:hypothetical protein
MGLTAIAIDTASKSAGAVGMTGMARATPAIAGGVPLEVRESMKQEAKTAAHRADLLTLVSLCVASGSAVCLYVSTHKREPAWRSIPLAVLIAYVMWLMVLV